MNTADIVARFDNRPGFEVATYQEVFLPLFELHTAVVILEKKPLTALEEYQLKAIDAGLCTLDEISGFLGLERQLIVRSMSELQRQSVIQEYNHGQIELTAKGKEVLQELVSIRPREAQYQFLFDAVTRRPRLIDSSELYRPKDIKQETLREIPGFPRRPPTPEEIDGKELATYLRDVNKREADFDLLDIKRVNKTYRLFQKAIMIVYKSEKTSDVPVSFLIDGRPSQAHDDAFQRNKGPERLDINEASIAANDMGDYFHDLGSKGDQIILAAENSRNKIQPLLRQISETRDLSERTKRRSLITEESDIREEIGRDLQKTTKQISSAKRELSQFPVRRLQVYEHPDVLQDSIKEAKERLAIISPWITRSVVDDEFVAELDKCLRRGVKVFIGYGIGDKNLPFGQKEAVESLKVIVNRYPELFILKELGDTHAKILIKDRDFYVVTSFNWLSFKGDPKKKFREEWGVYISDQVEVDDFFSTLELRFKDTKKTRP